MTVVSFKPESTDADPEREFRILYDAYRYAKAKWELAMYAPEMLDDDVPQEIDDPLSAAHRVALNNLLLFPAPTLAASVRKMTVFRDEEIWRSWSWAGEIVDCLTRDAERMMDSYRKA